MPEMNTHQAAVRLLEALAAALPYAPHRAEFDIVADAADDFADDLRKALERERERLQDPELSAALGYPGGISDPVLSRVELLRMVAEMRLAQPAAPQ